MTAQTFDAENFSDENGNPAGGYVKGVGLAIDWQNGPLGRGEDRIPANGAFVETVLEAVKQRIQYYQDAADGRFACAENATAISRIGDALFVLNQRTADREARQVEGTHEA